MKKIVSSVVDVANIHNYSVAASIFFQGAIFLFFLKKWSSKKYIGKFLIYFYFLKKKEKIKKYTFYPTTCSVNVAIPLLHVALVQQYITPCHVIIASIPSRKKSSASMMTRNVTEVLSLTIAVFIS